MTAARGGHGAADFSLPGRCTPSSWKPSFPVPAELQAGKLPARLNLNITIPGCPPADAADLPFNSPTGFPVLFFMNGFMNRAGWYHRLMQHVASWGLVTVQYDTPAFPLLTVAAELKLFPFLVKWVADQSDDPASPLHGLVDIGRVATGGHSRGGKLAALAFAGNPDLVRAAYLVDPIDVTKYSPESPSNPSAVRALAESGLPVGISAAGVISSCNPIEAGYQAVFPAAGNGSWLGLIPEASHSQFMDAGCIGNAAADLICKKGRDSRRQVAELTATPMLAWLWDQLVGQGQPLDEQQQAAADDGTVDDSSPLPAFISWVRQQQEAGLLKFEVKDEGSDGAWEEVAATTARLARLAPEVPAVQVGLGPELKDGDEEDCEAENQPVVMARSLD